MDICTLYVAFPYAKLVDKMHTVDKIKKMDGYDTTVTGPIMSNLAIGKQYRRKGLAESLVKSTETITGKEWGFNDCIRQKRNIPAIKLY